MPIVTNDSCGMFAVWTVAPKFQSRRSGADAHPRTLAGSNSHELAAAVPVAPRAHEGTMVDPAMFIVPYRLAVVPFALFGLITGYSGRPAVSVTLVSIW